MDSEYSYYVDWRDELLLELNSDDDGDDDDFEVADNVSSLSTSSSSSSDMMPSSSTSNLPLNPDASDVSDASLTNKSSADLTDDGQPSSDALSTIKPRQYQQEIFSRACCQNVIACLQTGAGKTLIAGMLIKYFLDLHHGEFSLNQNETHQVHDKSAPSTANHAHTSHSLALLPTLRNEVYEAPPVVIFLVDRVPLATQQAKMLESYLPSKYRVGCYYGDCGVDYWSPARWVANIVNHSVLVMTAQVFLNMLRHALITMQQVCLLVVDEAHHATKGHPYRRIFTEFYHTIETNAHKPHVFGMTATPVKKKSATIKYDSCLAAMAAVEATLDATVVTISDSVRHEIEDLVPKPSEFILSYMGEQPSNEAPEDVSTIEDELDCTLIASVLDSISVAFGQASPSKLEERGDLSNKEFTVLTRINTHLGFVPARDLATSFCQQREVAPAPVLANLLSQHTSIPRNWTGLTDKTQKLLDLLFFEFLRCCDEMRRNEDVESVMHERFRAIVFTQERISTLVLSSLISETFRKTKRPELEARPVVGYNQTGAFAHMTKSGMNRTIDSFRKGEFGVLVATNVVEEGIDIPACRLVIAFDRALSPTAYVQGRGRARKRGARYVAFVNSLREEDAKTVYLVREGAKVMSDIVSGGYVTEERREEIRDCLRGDTKTEKTLKSHKTPAKVTATECVELLARYLRVKAANLGIEELPPPRYDIENQGPLFAAVLWLDSRVPIDCGVCDEPQMSELVAKRHASLDAYRKLYEIGEVDDYLLPKKLPRTTRMLHVEKGKNDMSDDSVSMGVDGARGNAHPRKKKSRRLVQSKASKKHKRVRLCEINSSLDAVVHPDDVDMGCPQEHVPRNENDVMEICEDCLELNEAEMDETENECMYMYSIRLEQDLSSFKWYSSWAPRHYGILTREQLEVEDLAALRCPSGDSLFTLDYNGKVGWSKKDDDRARRYVRAVQLCVQGKTPGCLYALEMEKRYNELTRPTFFLLPLSESIGKPFTVDWYVVETLLTYGWRHGPLAKWEMRLPCEMCHTFVCSAHEGWKKTYIAGELTDNLFASSSPEEYLKSGYSSFCEYYQDKHDTVIQDPNQRLLEGLSVRESLARVSTSAFMLVPELLRVIPIDVYACYIACLLPQWQTFLTLRKCWRQKAIKPVSFLSFARALQPNVNNVSKENADLCYERSEFLGDAVLKVIDTMAKFAANPHEAEGDLSDERDINVSNGKLADAALKLQLHNCVAYSSRPPSVKSWPFFWGSFEKKKWAISEKVLADCVEALIGAHYQAGGIPSAAVFMERNGLLENAISTLGIDFDGDGRPIESNNAVVVNAPQDPSGNDIRQLSPFVEEVEKILEYKFQNRYHLVVALTHGSFESGRCASYQRYEYLGDAIIGFLILSYFFFKYPHFGPGELTKLRAPALSNDLFARVIITHDIHKKFWVNCRTLEADIEKCAEALKNEDEDGEDDICKTMMVPKVLGDLFESILGAVVVDQGMRLEKAREIALRLMEPELKRFANPNRFQEDPICQLLSKVQKKYHAFPKFVFTSGADDEVKQCEVFVLGIKLGRGTGPSRRIARRQSAIHAFEALKVGDIAGLDFQETSPCDDHEMILMDQT